MRRLPRLVTGAAAAALAAIAPGSFFPARTFSSSIAVPDAGSKRDLSGTWRGSDGTTLVLTYVGSGRHSAAGFAGELTIGSDLSSGDAYANLALSPPGSSVGATPERLLASRDRTRLTGAKRSFDREVPAGVVRLRVMQYNIEGLGWVRDPRGLVDTAAFLKAQAPDVVSLEEIKSLHVLGHELLSESAVIAHLGGFDQVFGSDRRKGFMDEGEALLIRKGSPIHPKLHKHASVVLPTHGTSSRQALVCDVDVNGLSFTVIATHTDDSAAQIQAVAGLVQGPAVVLGDLNSNPGSASLAALRASFLDAFAVANPGENGFTIPSIQPTRRIDSVWVAAGGANRSRVLASWVLPEPGRLCTGLADDHLPVVAEVELDCR